MPPNPVGIFTRRTLSGAVRWPREKGAADGRACAGFIEGIDYGEKGIV
jgi:hypothetical protein